MRSCVHDIKTNSSEINENAKFFSNKFQEQCSLFSEAVFKEIQSHSSISSNTSPSYSDVAFNRRPILKESQDHTVVISTTDATNTLQVLKENISLKSSEIERLKAPIIPKNNRVLIFNADSDTSAVNLISEVEELNAQEKFKII